MSEAMEKSSGLSCAVVQDLMPLEIDGVASPESGELVRAHMAGCEGCRAAYARMSADVGEKEQIPALRDVMRALLRRLSVRAALIAVAAVLALCMGVWSLAMSPVSISAKDIVPGSIEMVFEDGRAELHYTTRKDRVSMGYGWNIEVNPERENELTMYVTHNRTLLDWASDRIRYMLTGEGMALHVIDLQSAAAHSLEAADYPDSVISSVVYLENAGDTTKEMLLWQAEKDQYPMLTIEALRDGFKNRYE